MSSKKKEARVKKVYLGRPSNNVSIGIVGLPNIGKSSMFNLLSKMNVPAENYPFCTIDPSICPKVPVPDDRFDKLVESFKPKSVVPAVLKVHDIAGLVKGAAEGAGLGNAFLSHIASVDAIFHLVRAFKDKSIEHVEGDVDPIRDLEIISNELIQKDLSRVTAEHDELEKTIKRGIDKTKETKLAYETMKKAKECLESGTDIREYGWTNDDIETLNRLQLLTAKPIVYLANIAEKDFATKKNKWLGPINEWVQKRSPDAPLIPFSVTWEAKYLAAEQSNDAEELAKMTAEGVKSAMPKIIVQGYKALKLIHYFTAGADEVRGWTIKHGTLCPAAAGVIHTDFEKGFISADVYSYDDFIEYGSEAELKKAGKIAQRGKEYEVKDGDIMYFKAAPVIAGKKK